MVISLLIALFTIIPLGYGANLDMYYGESDESNTIILKRQKTPRHQMLNAPEYGVSFDSLFKKHHHHHHGTDPRTNDSIALYRYLDREFYGEIVIGHPGQKLNVAFDTTWSRTWVMSSKCESIQRTGCWFHNKYDHTKSSEYHADGTPFNQSEGSYNLTGFYSYDNISVAHSRANNQSFIEMVNVGNGFLFDKADGVMGLALKVADYDPFFYTLRKQGKIKDPIFSIYLNRDRQSKHGGNVMLGFLDKKHIHVTKGVPDPITTLKVDPLVSYWQFVIDKIVVADQKEPLTLCPNSCKAIPDTSGTNIVGPAADVAKIHDVIKAREFLFGLHTVDCDTVNKLPKIELTLGGNPFPLSGPNYIIKMSYRAITICVSAFTPAANANEEGMWILGGAFLSDYYSIYNTDTKEISFVKAA